MKRTNIRAGVVYAIKSSYGPPVPVVFLEDGAATVYDKPIGATGYRAHPEGTKARAGRGWSESSLGYATVGKYWDVRLSDALPDLHLKTASELKSFRDGGKPASSRLEFRLLTSLSRVVPWDEAVAEYEARTAHDRQRMKAADQMQIRRNTAIAALAGLGITAAPGDPGTVMLTLDEAEKVLRLAAKEADQ